ncbi:universal stress protein UspA [Cupriavidus sp. USMAA2-4]|uniref:Universal stress protein n=1 Tax=Cupriavidus malaysiensis TaxID=367825 RepID=A0ABN4TIT3_9BURK|nr:MULTISPECIES: universal stress protein [Cupriavidus]AOY90811.1 universal stress protein UspA [Cupriavidus sp. USMAA2-4]AOY99588.1 universal stress protein UspA [Cupriavidus sp. USMAHM13]AOZ06236.1 universal stress protein UspA [Cupriavidus malaysiensis]
MYQRILLAVDGSRSSDLALSQAITVAKATGAEVEAIFIADNSDLFFDVGYFDPSKIMDSIMAAGNEALSAAAARLAAEGVRHSTRLIDKPVGPGMISDTIIQEAVRWDADLLVLGTHGRRGVKRLVMGSVAEGVLHKSGKPVLLIRSEAPD